MYLKNALKVIEIGVVIQIIDDLGLTSMVYGINTVWKKIDSPKLYSKYDHNVYPRFYYY